MPTNRNRRPHAKRGEASENLIHFLRFGTWDHEAEDGFEIFLLDAPDRDALRAAWQVHGPAIMAEHIRERPGTRPYAWWECDAPRPADHPANEPAWITARRVDPRRQVGGTGLPMEEKYRAVLPWFVFGIPQMVDCDDDDPPAFESEAEYLRRHNLFVAGEERRLTAEDFRPEVLVVDDDAQDGAPERQEAAVGGER